MIYTKEESGIERAIHEQAGVANPRRAVSWVLGAVGSLVAGLVGGAIMLGSRPDWVWPIPVTGFIGYVLAFRRGMLMRNPNIDGTWRQYSCLGRPTASEGGQPANGRDGFSGGTKRLRVARSEPSHPPRHDLRVVR